MVQVGAVGKVSMLVCFGLPGAQPPVITSPATGKLHNKRHRKLCEICILTICLKLVILDGLGILVELAILVELVIPMILVNLVILLNLMILVNWRSW